MAGISHAGSGSSALSDPVDEARRVLAIAAEASVGLQVMGGVAVRLRCRSAEAPPLARPYGDIDYAGRSSDSAAIARLFSAAGYQPDPEFNALHGRNRLSFWDMENQREADVFLDTFRMCHSLDFRDQLTLDEHTLPLRTLLLFKLQVVETNDKDYKDALALLADHTPEAGSLDAESIASFLARDWGWWRTVTLMLERLPDYAGQVDGLHRMAQIRANIEAITDAIDRAPKSRRWKVRAKVGERMRWYEQPDEAHS